MSEQLRGDLIPPTIAVPYAEFSRVLGNELEEIPEQIAQLNLGDAELGWLPNQVLDKGAWVELPQTMWTELQEIAETAGWIQPLQLSLADLNPEQAQQSLQTMSPLARRVLTAYLQQGGGQVRASILAEQLGEPLDKVRAALEEINFMQ